MKIIHGSSVELDGKAILIKGKSGSGKSSLALKLIMLGARLIADDQTTVFVEKKQVLLRAPPLLPPGLEIRGVGFVHAPICKQAELKLVVDLSKYEKKRFPNPDERSTNILGYSFPFYFFQGIKDPANAIYAVVKFGKMDM